MKLTFDNVKDIVRLHRARDLSYIELYKKFFMWLMDRQAKLDEKAETKWMSNISSPVIYMLCMAVYGMYQDSKVSFEVYRKIKKAKGENLTEEEQKEYDEQVKETTSLSNQLIDLIEHVYDASNGTEEFDMSVLDAIILGNGFGGIGYDKCEERYQVIDPVTKGKKEIIEKINLPSIYRIVPLNFYTELSAPTQQKAKVNVVRKIATEDTINSMYGVYGIKYKKDGRKKEDIIEEKDWNMVLRFMMFNNMPQVITKRYLGLTSDSDSYLGELSNQHTDIWTDNSFKIGKDLNEIYEVHTDQGIQIFINGEDKGVFARLGPWKKKPFYKLSFRDGVNGLYDIGVGYLGYNYHKTVDAFLNMRIDNDRLVGSSPLIVNADDNYFDGMDFLEQYPGKLIKVKDVATSIRPLDLSSNGASVANSEVDMLSKYVQDIVGVPGYRMGVQQKVERSARGVAELIQSADAAMKPFIESVAKAKAFIAKYIALLAITYMEKEDIEKICGSDELQTKLNIEDLIKEYTVTFDIQSSSVLRERQELDAMKNIIRDFAGATRPDGTPLLNQEYAFKSIIEKSGLPEGLILSEDDALDYMKSQVDRNAELKKYEAEKIPQQPLAPQGEMMEPQGIVPGFNEQAGQDMPMGAAPEPNVQAGSFGEGMAESPNLEGENQFT